MKRVPVTSTNLESVGYDAASRTLEIEFKNGRHVYQYFDVPPQIHSALMAAQPHPGTFLASNIKGRYRYARVS
ncbi:MAG: KTSC domain-containing protein [Planctomycetes bacterium]|nr:KTSC domain-containing protein [Planctomycetota bacterium]